MQHKSKQKAHTAKSKRERMCKEERERVSEWGSDKSADEALAIKITYTQHWTVEPSSRCRRRRRWPRQNQINKSAAKRAQTRCGIAAQLSARP